MNRACHYDWIKSDPEYAKAFAEAEANSARSLEDEAVRRASMGIRKAVRYKGKIVGYETEYSDTLLLALLRANNPKKFVEGAAVNVNVSNVMSVADTIRTRRQERLARRLAEEKAAAELVSGTTIEVKAIESGVPSKAEETPIISASNPPDVVDL